MDGQAVEGRGVKRRGFSRTTGGLVAGAVCLMLGLVWWQRRADDFGGAVLAVEGVLGLNKEPEPVSGTVTVNGQPLARGTITFSASETSVDQPNRASFFTEVRDGRYGFPPGAGPTPGGYGVSITRWSPALDRAREEASRGRLTNPDVYKDHSYSTKTFVKANHKNDFDVVVPGW